MANDENPKEGSTYECATCGMVILVTKECNCEDGRPFFSCCGTEMKRSN